MDSTIIPAFDPDSPDRDILAAYERVRANNEWSYSYDDLPESLWPIAEMDEREEAQDADEGFIRRTRPVTLAGMLPRLLLEFCRTFDERWIDRTMAERGVLAVIARRSELGDEAYHALTPIVWLLHVDWVQALAHNERASDTHTHLFRLNDVVDTEECRQAEGGVPQFVADVSTATEQLITVFSSGFALRNMIRTLAPNEAAYLRKYEIAAAEGLLNEAAPWLARDTKFLLGATAHLSGEI